MEKETAQYLPEQDLSMDSQPESPAPPKPDALSLGDLPLADKSGLIQPQQEARVKGLIVQWVKSGQLPRQYQVREWGEERKRVSIEQAQLRVWYAVQALTAVRMTALTNLRFVAYIEGQSMFFGDLPLSLVQRDKLLAEPPDEFWLDKDYRVISRQNKNSDAKPFMAVCRMRFAGGDMGWREREYTLQDARDNGKYLRDNDGELLLSSNDARVQNWLKTPWNVHTRRMLQMRSRSWLIKDIAPQSLNGVPQAEYDAQEVPAEIMDVRHAPSAPAHTKPAQIVDARSDDDILLAALRHKEAPDAAKERE